MCNTIISNKFNYSKRSLCILDTVSPLLSVVFTKALSLGLIDIVVVEGVRDKEKQNLYYKQCKSRVKWPESKHNIVNDDDFSKAIDAAPYVNGKLSDNYYHCVYLAGIITGIGMMMGIKIRWGGNWDCDGEIITDQNFNDLFHYELIRE